MRKSLKDVKAAPKEPDYKSFKSPAQSSLKPAPKTEHKSLITSAQRNDYNFEGRDLSRKAHQWADDED